MPFNDDTSDLSTGCVSLPPTSPDERDRFRLGRDIIRDFNHDSFPSISARGGARDATDTVDSFDISADALGVSTRHSEMLPHSPTIESRRLQEEFKDFSMALPPEVTELSIEVARAGMRDREKDKEDRLKPAEYSSQLPFSIGSAAKSDRSGKRSLFADFDLSRKDSVSSAHSDPSEYLTAMPRRSGNSANSRKSKEPTPAANNRAIESPLAKRTESFPNFDLSSLDALTPKKNDRNTSTVQQKQQQLQQQQQQSAQKDQPGVSKISEVVSNSGSGGSRKSRFDDYKYVQNEGEISDVASISDRLRFTNSRFGPSTKKATPNNSTAGPSRSRFGMNGFATAKVSDEDLTSDVPAIIAKSRKGAAAEKAAPKGFKSTDTFLLELGLDGHTTTSNFQEKLNALKDVGPGPTKRNYDNKAGVSSTPGPSGGERNVDMATPFGFTQQSFLLPQISDISELISGYPGETTRYGRKRGYGNAKTYKPIESIPVPHDERAVLMAMRLLQEKVAGLEESKAVAEQKCAKLEGELKNYEIKLQHEQRRARLAQEALKKKRSGDSAFGGSDDEDAEEKRREKARLESQMERLRLDATIKDLRVRNDEIARELDTAKIALRNMQEERNSAVNSVALALSTNDDLKNSNQQLKDEIEKLKLEIYENELRSEREREEWRVREEKFRRRLRDAREVAAVAEEAMKEAARRDTAAAEAIERAKAEKREAFAREREERERAERERAEEEKKQREEQARAEFERKVEAELRRIRPDLFEGRENGDEPGPVSIAQNDSKSGKNVVIEASPNPKPVVELRPKVGMQVEKDLVVEDEAAEDDTAMSISPEEIRRIAKEINEGRRKRKAAVKEANERAVQEKAEADVAAARATAASAAGKPRPMLKPKIKSRFTLQKPAVPAKPVEIAAPVTVQETNTAKNVPIIQKQRLIKIPKSRKKLLKPEAVAGPSNPKTNGEVVETHPQTETSTQTTAQTQTQTQPQSEPRERKKRTKKLVKIVYYLDEDTTRSFPLEKEIEEEINDIEEAFEDAKHSEEHEVVRGEPKKVQIEEVPESHAETDTEELQQEYTSAVPPRPPSSRPPTVSFATPDLFERAQNAIDHQAVHDPSACTVCARNEKLRLKEEELRLENPLADIDNSMAVPAPSLEPVSTRSRTRDGNRSGIGFGAGFFNRSFDEEPTFRPSGEPKKQLTKVVRQLQDEFKHLKLDYQEKSDQLFALDPAVEKRKRKALTREMNELIAEMDYKCDQIYALYDVNEEFVEGSEEEEDEDGLFEEETREMEREIEREKERMRIQEEQMDSEDSGEENGSDEEATTEELIGRLPGGKW